MKKIISYSPKQSDVLLYVALIVVVLVFFKKFTSFFSGLFKSDAEKQNDKIFDSVKVNKNNMTISEAQAVTYSQRLYDAMAGFNDDEQEIFNVFNFIKNPDDMKAVFVAFGLRRLWGGTGNLVLGEKKNLSQWLYSELTSDELKKIENKLKWI